MHGNEPGIDPYTRAVSDVYQDIFGEGSFIGKGIYDIDAFENALANRFPDNRILSHDLLEGSYARCGLLSDVQLYEAYPVRYDADMKRRHRWIRGDWQIASWLLPWVPGPSRKILKNPISPLSRWKIFDNLRRSLVPLALLVMLLFGWMYARSPVFWTLAVLSIVFLNSIISFFWEIWQKPEDVRFLPHVIMSIRYTIQHFTNQIFLLISIPYEAIVYADAIWRTNWRLLISHRRLLQWNPSVNELKQKTNTLFESYLRMWFPVVLSIAAFVWMQYIHADGIGISLPFLVVWMLSPALAWRISLPDKSKSIDLNEKEKLFLNKLSRKTWAFFENFIGTGDNWLPPDNYQESPVERIAHRTSPTNIGLSLLANLTAFDFGYIPMHVLLFRVSNTLQTLQRMERYAGHFYNWYDTQTLQPLPPKYISTVDSGNMAGHLITLKQGLLMLEKKHPISNLLFSGLLTTLEIVEDKMGDKIKTEPVKILLREGMVSGFDSVRKLHNRLKNLLEEAERLTGLFHEDSEAAWWADAFANQVREAFHEVKEFSPWLSIEHFPERV